MKSAAPVHLVTGDEPVLRREALDKLVASLLGNDDASLALEDVTIVGSRSASAESSTGDEGGSTSDAVALAVNAASTPPFGTERRIVVIHEAGALTVGAAAPLIAYLADPCPTSVVVLVAGGGTIPAALVKAVKEAGGEEHKTTTGIETVLREHLHEYDITFDPDALSLAVARLGDDPGRTPAVVELLHSIYGPAVTLSAAQIEPYIGESGIPAPYLLTNAIDAGDVPLALELLERLRTGTDTRQARPMHSLQIMGLLQSHYRKLVRVDSPQITSEDDAVAALGGKTKPFAAKKVVMQSRRLGIERLRTAFDLLAQGDLDIKGASGVPEDAIVEVLVVRLAGLSRAAGAGSTARTGRAPARRH